MNLNDTHNVINVLTELDERKEDDLSKFDYNIYLVKKQKEADIYYSATEISLAPEVQTWAKKQLINTLKKLKNQNEENKFIVGNYNDEIQRKEQLAELNMDSMETLKKKKDDLNLALRNHDQVYDESKTNFIIVRVNYNGQEALLGYYRSDKGAKTNVSRNKKKIYRIKNTNQFEFVDHTVIELGGIFHFILIRNKIFINNVTYFEYTFDYRDEINRKRDQNIATIISMPFFEDSNVNVEEFEKSCKKFIFSRSLAQIKPSTLSALQENFEERCEELAELKRRVPEESEAKERYKKELGTIWDLFDYIDFENKTIKFDKGQNPKPLIHFFADKIARSFLTEDYKVVAAYE